MLIEIKHRKIVTSLQHHDEPPLLTSCQASKIMQTNDQIYCLTVVSTTFDTINC